MLYLVRIDGGDQGDLQVAGSVQQHRKCILNNLQERHFCVSQSDRGFGHGKTTLALSSVINS